MVTTMFLKSLHHKKEKKENNDGPSGAVITKAPFHSHYIAPSNPTGNNEILNHG